MWEMRYTSHWPIRQSSWWDFPSRVLHMSREYLFLHHGGSCFLTNHRIATRSWPRSSSLSLINLQTSTLCARLIISDDWICYVSHAKARYEAPTSLPWTANTTLSISLAVFARLSLVHKIHTTSTKVMCTATTTTRPNLRKSAMDVKPPS